MIRRGVPLPPRVVILAGLFLSATLPATAQSNQETALAGASSIDLAARDTRVRPGDDFWRFSNGTWLTATPLPPGRNAWGLLSIIAERNATMLRTLLEAGGETPGWQQAAALYASYLDEPRIEARGLAPAQPYLDRINAAATRDDLIALFATPGLPSPVTVDLSIDPENIRRFIPRLRPAGHGFYGAESYLSESSAAERAWSGYRVYVGTLLRLSGRTDLDRRAGALMALERSLAQTGVNVRAPYPHVVTRSEIAALVPEFNWALWFDRRGISEATRFNLIRVEGIKASGRLFAETPIETWKDWLTIRFLDSYAQFLPRAVAEAQDEFRTLLTGIERRPERWRRALDFVGQGLPDSLGTLYARHYFPPDTRTRAEALIDEVRGAFRDRIQAADWLDGSTRRDALAKLDALTLEIGSPRNPMDYSAIRIQRDDLLGNVLRIREACWRAMLVRPAMDECASWSVAASSVNSYYSPTQNRAVFPAGIFQRPIFDPSGDPAANYGAIGAVIGTKLSDALDANGRFFLATGEVGNLWSAGTARHFDRMSQMLIDQYSRYPALPGLNVDGRRTVNENAADLAGLEIAYAAYRRHVAAHGELPMVDRLTGDQRFFLAYAQMWRTRLSDDALRQRLVADPHSPPEYRVNGVVRNVDAWYRAFNIQPGDRLYLPPGQRVHIW